MPGGAVRDARRAVRSGGGAAEAPTAEAPRTPDSWLALAASQYEARRYEDSIRSSERALELRPAYAEAFNDICAAEIALGNFGSAADACEHALAIDPSSAPARTNLAKAREGRNRRERRDR